jgi:hypothetical protein
MPEVAPRSSGPSEGRVVRRLKDGYWDQTDVIEMPDGTRRVRKRSKGTHAPGPWGLESLRREIRYLAALAPDDVDLFPPLLAWWDTTTSGVPDIGYEITFLRAHRDAGEWARTGALPQFSIDHFQEALADRVLQRLHRPVNPEASLAQHMTESMASALDALMLDPMLAPIVQAEELELNSRRLFGPRRAMQRVLNRFDVKPWLDGGAQVRIHGDLFLENILWCEEPAPNNKRQRVADTSGISSETRHDALTPPRLILIDPVSVAGISSGLPLFDLVKYESYATGVLPALRLEAVDVLGLGSTSSAFEWRVRWDEPAVAAFRERDWHRRFRAAYEAKYGLPDQRAYFFIDAYFGLAMALNTGGSQRPARLLKATEDLNAILHVG